MTDKEKLIQMLTDLGVGYEDDGRDVVCQAGNEKVVGYPEFYTVFSFDDQGRFINMGAFE